jgi:hypothetical protein
MRELVETRLSPAEVALEGVRREYAIAIDAFMASPPKGFRMTRRRRAGLVFAMLEFAKSALANGEDPVLTEICMRHGVGPAGMDEHDERALEVQIEQICAEVLGEGQIERMEDEPFEDFAARAHARLNDHFEEEGEREHARAQERKAKRRQKASAAPQAERQASAEGVDPIRGIYRRLASSLHPDRELDPEEKARKTLAMQSLNEAYRNKDLLTLMKYQAEQLGHDDRAAPDLADEVVRGYVDALKQQLKAIKRSVSDMRDAVVPPMVAARYGRIARPERLTELLMLDVRRFETIAAEMRAGLLALADPKRCKQEVDTLVEMMEEQMRDQQFEEVMEDMLVEMFGR